MPLGAFHLLQLQQKRGRLPHRKKMQLNEHTIEAVLSEASKFTLEELYVPVTVHSRIPVAGEIDIDAYLELAPPRAHHPYPVITLKPVTPTLTILFDVSASLDARQRYSAFIMLCVLLHHFPQSIVLAFSTHTHVIKTSRHRPPFSAVFEAIQNIQPEYTHLKEAIIRAVHTQRSLHNLIILLSDGSSNYGLPPLKTDLSGHKLLFF